MDDAALRALHKESSMHREAVLASPRIGCFFCIRTFEPKEVNEWWDQGQTAVCPNCGIDAILPNTTDPAILAAMNERWFCGDAIHGDEFMEDSPESKP